MKITKKEALKKIRQSNGKLFGVTFIKKNGSLRDMNCRLGVQKGVKGVGMSYNPSEYNLICVFDVKKDSFRMINLKTITRLSISGQTYEV